MRYAIPGFSTLLLLLVWQGEQFLSQLFGESWPQIPWGLLLLLTAAVLVGMAYADFCMPTSDLRRWLRDEARLFEVNHTVLAHKSSEGNACYQVECSLRFTSSIKNVSISVKVDQYVHVENARTSFVILNEEIGEVVKDLHKNIVVARFPIRVSPDVHPGNPSWVGLTEKIWAGDGHHIVSITARSRFRRQEEKFLIAAIKDVGGGPEPVILLGGPDSRHYVQIGGPG